MMSKNEKALEKLKSRIKPDPGTWKKEAQWRFENKTWIRKSQKIAFKILHTLREQKKSQKELAEMMNVSPQQVNKWVKGKENFTLETLSRIEEALKINLLLIEQEKSSKFHVEEAEKFHKPIFFSHNSILYNTVKEYLESREKENRSIPFLSNYRSNFSYVKHFKSYSKENKLGSEFEKELSEIWTLFETKENEARVIELKPKSTYNKKINLEDFLAAEPDLEYY